ncbi:MAG TPA: ABC transporter permease [Candidatus Brocadiia bacterium]|nr:ABC transporter permease [Candidatus Brocadiia bacterium]
MKAILALSPIARILVKKWPRTLLAVFSASFGFATIFTTIAVGEDVRAVLLTRLFRDFPAKRIDVYPTGVDLFGFSIKAPNSNMDATTASRLAAIPGVAGVGVEEILPVPTHMVADFLPEDVDVECSIYGADPAVIETSERFKGFRYDPGFYEVPVVISRSILEGYNSGFASVHKLPKLTETAIIGQVFTVVIGESLFTQNPTRSRRIACRVVGVSSTASLAGITAPREYVAEWLAWWTRNSDAALPVNRLVVTVSDAMSVDGVCRRIAGMGFTPLARREEGRILENAAGLVGMFQWLIAGAVLLCVTLLLSAQLSASVYEKRPWYALFQAIGATPRLVAMLILFESMIYSVFGVVIGSSAALLIRKELAARVMTSIPGLDDLAFGFPSRAVAAILAAGLAVALAAALPACVRLMRTPPAGNLLR